MSTSWAPTSTVTGSDGRGMFILIDLNRELFTANAIQVLNTRWELTLYLQRWFIDIELRHSNDIHASLTDKESDHAGKQPYTVDSIEAYYKRTLIGQRNYMALIILRTRSSQK